MRAPRSAAILDQVKEQSKAPTPALQDRQKETARSRGGSSCTLGVENQADVTDIVRRAAAEHMRAETEAPVYVLNRPTGIVHVGANAAASTRTGGGHVFCGGSSTPGMLTQ